MIVGVVIDAHGHPVCSEMWPGSTADVSVLLPVVARLRHRFGIHRVCAVADSGMISAATTAALEDRGLEYVLGVRERNDSVVRHAVIDDKGIFTPLLVQRAAGETQLFVKEVKAEGRRYIVCRNEAEAEKDRTDRAAIIEGLDRQLKKGDKPEWTDLLRDLDRVQQATIDNAGKTWRIRTQATGAVPALMKALRIALPPRAQAPGPPPLNAAPPTQKRRGRPRHSATSR